MTPQPPFRKWEIAALAGLVLVFVTLAWPGLRAPLLLDDEDEVALVRQFAGWSSIWQPDCYGLFRPVKNALFYGLLPVLDGDPIVFHAVGVLCFLAGMTGVYFLVRRVASCAGTALGVAAVWALAPTQVSTIIWLSAANIGICVCFMCLALIMYDKSREDDPAAAWPRVPWLLGAAAATFMGQISYETAVAIAPMALAMDWFRGRKLFARNTVLALGVLSLVTVSYLLLRGHYGSRVSASVGNMGFEPGLEKWKLTVSAPWFLWQHLLMWFAPVGRIELASTYLWLRSASPAALAWSWAGWVALLALLFLLRKKYPAAALGLAWFLIAAFPAGNFVPIFAGPIEDYYLTVSSIGLALLLVSLAAPAIKIIRARDGTSPLLPVVLCLILILPRLALLPVFNAWASLWVDPLAIYARVLDSRPHQFQARALMARELLLAGHPREAAKEAMQATQEGPWHPVPLVVLGGCALAANDTAAAVSWFEKVLALKSGVPEVDAYANLQLGMLLGKESKTRPIAMDHLRVVLARPNSQYHARAVFELAELYHADNDREKFLATLRRGVDMHPGNAALADALRVAEDGQHPPSPDGSGKTSPPAPQSGQTP